YRRESSRWGSARRLVFADGLARRRATPPAHAIMAVSRELRGGLSRLRRARKRAIPLAPARGGTFNRSMLRKPAVPTIPAKPTGRPKPERSRAHPKLTVLTPEQLDLWGAFAAPRE